MKRTLHRLPASLRWGLLAQFTARYAVRATVDAIHALDDALLPLDDDLEACAAERVPAQGQRVGVGIAAA